jgi:two-component system, chemotaxis family, CheB/CheR fusion protein
VVDKRQQILRFSGSEVGRYLEPSSGPASLDLLGILRKPPRPVVRAALRTVHATNQPVVQAPVPIRSEGKSRFVTVIVEPIGQGEAEAGLCVVAFREAADTAAGKHAEAQIESSDAASEALKQELHTTRTQLQSTIDELETTNEGMKSAAEEYQAVNEELQSTNEELETSKEEMQSINEELQTIIRALGQAADGTIDVAEDHARLEVMLPWPLAQIADKIQRAIQSQGKTMLEKK